MSCYFFFPCVFKNSIGERREQEWMRKMVEKSRDGFAVILGTGCIRRITLASVCSHPTFFHFSDCKQLSLWSIDLTPLLTLQAHLLVSECLNQSSSVVSLDKPHWLGQLRLGIMYFEVVLPSWIWTWGTRWDEGADLMLLNMGFGNKSNLDERRWCREHECKSINADDLDAAVKSVSLIIIN